MLITNKVWANDLDSVFHSFLAGFQPTPSVEDAQFLRQFLNMESMETNEFGLAGIHQVTWDTYKKHEALYQKHLQKPKGNGFHVFLPILIRGFGYLV